MKMENKMSDTITEMKLIHADNLQPDQLMLGDLIKIGDDIVEILFIESDSTGDNYDVQTENEFGEKEVTQYSYTDSIPLYVFIDDDDD
jgi:regulatory protein YycH of two-component signal transduction system YycFG